MTDMIGSGDRHPLRLQIRSIRIANIVANPARSICRLFSGKGSGSAAPQTALRSIEPLGQSGEALPAQRSRWGKAGAVRSLFGWALSIVVLSASALLPSPAIAQTGPVGTLGVQMQVSDTLTSDNGANGQPLAPGDATSCTINSGSIDFGSYTIVNPATPIPVRSAVSGAGPNLPIVLRCNGRIPLVNSSGANPSMQLGGGGHLGSLSGVFTRRLFNANAGVGRTLLFYRLYQDSGFSTEWPTSPVQPYLAGSPAAAVAAYQIPIYARLVSGLVGDGVYSDTISIAFNF